MIVDVRGKRPFGDVSEDVALSRLPRCLVLLLPPSFLGLPKLANQVNQRSPTGFDYLVTVAGMFILWTKLTMALAFYLAG